MIMFQSKKGPVCDVIMINVTIMITSPVLVIKKDAILPKSEVITSEKKMTSYGNMTNAEVEEGNLPRVGVLCDHEG